MKTLCCPRGREVTVVVTFLAAFITVTGCGGGGGHPATAVSPPPTVLPSPNAFPAVFLSPDTDSLLYGQSTVLRWNAPNAVAITASNFGAATLPGVATVTPTETTRYTLTVADIAGVSATATATVRVASVAVTSPAASVALNVSEATPFTAQVSGAVNPTVLWSIEENEVGGDGGSISTEGRYTAPAFVGVFHVRATSVADPRQSFVITVHVRAASGVVQIQ